MRLQRELQVAPSFEAWQDVARRLEEAEAREELVQARAVCCMWD